MPYTKVNEWTTLQERLAIARKHNVKTRATVANLLAGRTRKNKNVPLLDELVAKAEENERAARIIEERAEALPTRK